MYELKIRDLQKRNTLYVLYINNFMYNSLLNFFLNGQIINTWGITSLPHFFFLNNPIKNVKIILSLQVIGKQAAPLIWLTDHSLPTPDIVINIINVDT